MGKERYYMVIDELKGQNGSLGEVGMVKRENEING